METPTFKRLGKAFIEGMSFFIPFSSYESRLFLARRLAGIPGYQYDVDLSKETIQRQIFTPEELQKFKDQFQNCPGHEYRRNMVFNEKMYVLEVKKNEDNYGSYTNLDDNNNDEQPEDEGKHSLSDIMNIKLPDELIMVELNDDDFKSYLSDRKINELSFRNQFLVKAGNHHAKMIENRFTRPIYEAVLSFYLFLMEKYHNNHK